MKIEYALYIAENIIDQDNDQADWFSTLEEALEAARAAIENGETEEAEIRKFDTEASEVLWDYPITVDGNGSAWSDDDNARDELGFVQ